MQDKLELCKKDDPNATELQELESEKDALQAHSHLGFGDITKASRLDSEIAVIEERIAHGKHHIIPPSSSEGTRPAICKKKT